MKVVHQEVCFKRNSTFKKCSQFRREQNNHTVDLTSPRQEQINDGEIISHVDVNMLMEENLYLTVLKLSMALKIARNLYTPSCTSRRGIRKLSGHLDTSAIGRKTVAWECAWNL
ncbi:hypothetical protein TNIN_272711 [Trichonephila inaurata madagascariensis]|uniref:Uncharacterized protein n=1 Tax=Trichonephila inaurata madagascariensis TaxID=2747483 RepID=A0A8X6Y205_9ARAC|nr:hypothetical protein TNIN_272711 [Trichonephila inaurata madagascariensis]